MAKELEERNRSEVPKVPSTGKLAMEDYEALAVESRRKPSRKNMLNPKAALRDLELCRAYLLSQLEDRPQRRQAGPAITISSQAGAGADEVAKRLAKILRDAEPEGTCPWTVFNRQLVEKVLEEQGLPQSLAKYMPEDRCSYIKEVMEELLGLHPPSWVMVPRIAETVLHLADAGHVILVGRGANLITAGMPSVFHARLIGSLPNRIARVQKLHGVSRAEAANYVAQSDRGRKRYLKAHFHMRPEDDLLYHLVINTDLIPTLDAAQLIADAARCRFQRAA